MKMMTKAQQLKIGTKIEMEHTRSKKIAENIAKDHLKEYPNYYTEFVKFEAKLIIILVSIEFKRDLSP